MKIWDKGYEINREVEEFTVGNDYMLDQNLVEFDCLASIAHAKMLGKMGILTADEVNVLQQELNNVILLHQQGNFPITREDEDCHTAIEKHLTQKLGDTGKKIHTARSRNDQVLTALRLYYKDRLKACKESIKDLLNAIDGFIMKSGSAPLPGYTHMRKAMPSSVSLWASAFIDALRDDLQLVDTANSLIDQSPLGTGAGYGIPLDMDRELTARELGFSRIQENPIYTQLSRGKFESTILHTLSQVLFDLNKISTDLATFSMPEFGFFVLPNEVCTGSSIMPQKKNPDVLELVRGNYHLVVSYEMQVKTLTANLLSGYNRDVQLTKEPVMKGFDIALRCLSIMQLIFGRLEVNREKCEAAMTSELFATEKAYNLVKQGVPFREAYRRIAEEYME